MPHDCVSYKDSGYFIPLIIDYLEEKENLNSLYNRFPTIENFKFQIEEKAQNYPNEHRQTLVSVLEEQYQSLSVSELTSKNIKLLLQPNTFTITTGHQLNLLTGPLYFLYKIISAINLAKELSAAYPGHHFVPVYWMATEDHDFEEINFFNFKGKKFRWNRENSGPVGRLTTEGLAEILKLFSMELGAGKNAEDIVTLFEKSYLQHDNLTSATRFLANELFGQYGLVILDADKSKLKNLFAPYIKDELVNQISHKQVLQTTEHLKEYNIQVNPREINLFYMEDGLRERIIIEDGKYLINNTRIQFTQEEIIRLVDQHPEKFSPNVIMRPLYQEVILPNLCYIGGGGEIAYWLELKSYFNTVNATFPILLLRNSVLIATAKQAAKADRLKLSWSELFLKSDDLKNKQIKNYSQLPIDFQPLKETLVKQFQTLHEIAIQTDKSFSGALKAQETKQLKGLDNLQRRILKAEKIRHADALERISDLQNELFPDGKLQERFANFSEFYLENGNILIDTLINKLKPLEHNFDIIIFKR